MPSFIYFDLDDTLLDHRHAERLALADVCRDFEHAFGRFDLVHVQETYHRHNVQLWHRYALGDIEKDELKRLRFEQLLVALAVGDLQAGDVNEHYLDCYARHWTFIEGAREAFLAVAARYPVGILTNGFSEVQHAKLDRFPELRERTRAVIISEEVGFMKPHPQLFAHAATRAGVPPAEILYVGDSFTSDVRGGLDAGWQVAWYRGDPNRLNGEAGAFCFETWDALCEQLDV